MKTERHAYIQYMLSVNLMALEIVKRKGTNAPELLCNTYVSQTRQQNPDSSLNAKLCGQIHIRFQHLLEINVHIIAKPVNAQAIPTL
jgi:hypothetical protein